MRILQIVHGFPPAGCGGTEAYVHDLATALAATGLDEVVVLTREADPQRPELSVRRYRDGAVSVVAINNLFQACANFEESYTNPALRRIARELIAQIDPDVVHVQHLTCLSTGLLEDVKAAGIPLVMTLNDYWLICHRGQLFDRDGHRCAGPFDDGCGACIPPGMLASPTAFRAGRLARTLPIPGAAAAVGAVLKAVEAVTPRERTREATSLRLQQMRDAARHADLFLAPSRTMAAMFERFGLTNVRACDQGIDLRPFAQLRRKPSPTLRVAFAGSLIPSKGPHVLLEAAALLPAGTIALDVIGATAPYHGDDDYAARIEPLLQRAPVRHYGPIPHERMAAALADVDLVVVPSVWIENAPFIIREAFAAGVPVVASDLGGMAEMVRDGVDGRLFPTGDAAALAAILRHLGEDRSELERLRVGIRPPMSIEQDAANCRAVYTSLVTRESRQSISVAASTPGRTRIAAVVLNYRTPEQTCLAVRALQTSVERLDEIIVVDNGSGDRSPEHLRATLSDVAVLAEEHNLGFSAGSNVGIRRALDHGADAVLLVNSDAVVAPDAIAAMREVLDGDPSIGIVAPVLLSREEPDRIASAGIRLSARTARMRHRAAGQPMSLLPPGPVHRVDAASGCVMLIRRQVFERAGLLDEAYFFSFEDIDFCLRAKAAGFDTVVAQQAIVYHEGGRSIGRRSARRVYFATRNHLRLSKRAGPPGAALARAPLVVGLNLAYVLISPDAPLGSGLVAVARGTLHHVARRYGAD
ncbi:MAG TPA: glycosyltransferase [Vicinamibacterales bacterium]